jgi:uncharacterized protein (TIGR02285 family)
MRFFLAMFAVLFWSSCLCAAEDQSLIWYKKDFPPYVIVQGTEKGKGIDDQIMQYMIKRLPEYEHSFEEANYSRITNDLKNQRHGITTPIFKTPEREKFMFYSGIPSYLVLPNGLIINRSDKKKFQPFILGDGSLDIEALCSAKHFVIGVASERSYAGILDEMIKRYKDTGVFYERPGAEYLGILTMLHTKRIDAVFGFPVEVKYFGLENELETLRVSKMVPCIPVYFGVPKNEWGKELTDRLNEILKKEGTLAEFAGYYEYWLDENGKTYYRQLIKEYYGANFNTSI